MEHITINLLYNIQWVTNETHENLPLIEIQIITGCCKLLHLGNILLNTKRLVTRPLLCFLNGHLYKTPDGCLDAQFWQHGLESLICQRYTLLVLPGYCNRNENGFILGIKLNRNLTVVIWQRVTANFSNKLLNKCEMQYARWLRSKLAIITGWKQGAPSASML